MPGWSGGVSPVLCSLSSQQQHLPPRSLAGQKHAGSDSGGQHDRPHHQGQKRTCLHGTLFAGFPKPVLALENVNWSPYGASWRWIECPASPNAMIQPRGCGNFPMDSSQASHSPTLRVQAQLEQEEMDRREQRKARVREQQQRRYRPDIASCSQKIPPLICSRMH